MHDTALAIGEQFFRLYARSSAPTIVEFGAMNVNGSLRDVAPEGATYVGLDLEAGPGVDIVVSPGDKVPLAAGYADLVVSSSALEHDAAFWITFKRMCRICKAGGYIYINVPSNGFVHSYPLDCWRFYPDAGIALEAFSERSRYPVTLIESFVANRRSDFWNDFVAIFRRGGAGRRQPERLYSHFSCHNVYDFRSKDRLNIDHQSEDQKLAQGLRLKVQELTDLNAIREQALQAEIESVRSEWSVAAATDRAEMATLRQQVAAGLGDIERLQGALAQDRASLTMEAERLAAAQGEADRLGRELDLARQHATMAVAEADDLRAALLDLQAGKAALEEEIGRNGRRADELVAQVESLRSELAHERAARATDAASLDESIARHTVLDAQHQALRSELARLTRQLGEEQAETNRLTGVIDAARRDAGQAWEQTAAARLEAQTARAAFEEQSRQSHAQADELTRQLEHLRNQSEIDATAIATDRAALQLARNDLSQANVDLDKGYRRIRELEAYLTMLRAAQMDWMRWKSRLESTPGFRIDRALARWLKVSPLGFSENPPRLTDLRGSSADDQGLP
jgi:SAM-dependent methyltransferase